MEWVKVYNELNRLTESPLVLVVGQQGLQLVHFAECGTRSQGKTVLGLLKVDIQV